MYRSCIGSLLTILIVSFVGRMGVQAQTTSSSVDQALVHQVDDENSTFGIGGFDIDTYELVFLEFLQRKRI